MINLYTGTPGSGKSLHAAQQIKTWIKTYDCPVIGNFGFKASALKARKWGGYVQVSNHSLTPDFLIKFAENYREKRGWKKIREDKILLVIDECQLIFNARDWGNKDRSGWVSFFTQHRKLGYRVTLICQFNQMIDKQIRALIEYEFLHRKVANIGKAGSVMSLITGGGLHVCVKIYVPLKLKVGSDFFKADKGLYSLYDTFDRF